MRSQTRTITITLIWILVGTPMMPVVHANPFIPCECESWISTYTGPDDLTGTPYNWNPESAIDPNGDRIYVTGWSRNNEGDWDFATVAYDSVDGTRLWDSRFVGSDGATDIPTSISVSPDGSKVFVTGRSGHGGSKDAITIAYDAQDGNELWHARVEDSGATSIGVSTDNTRVFVGGWTRGATSDEFLAVAFDANDGSMDWVAQYNGPSDGTDHGSKVVVSPDGTYVTLVGHSWGVGTSMDYTILAYDADTGVHLWEASYNSPYGGFIDRPAGVTISPDGSRIFVTGESRTGNDISSRQYATVAYAALDGSELWASRYDGPGELDDGSPGDTAQAITVSPDGSKVFVTGRSEGTYTGTDYATIAYDAASGAELWAARYGGLYRDQATDIVVSPDGSQVLVTGQSQRLVVSAGGTGVGLGQLNDALTISYDPNTGLELWTARFNDGKSEELTLVVGPDSSRVFVTSQSKDAIGTQTNYAAFMTMAYDLPIPTTGSNPLPDLPV